MTKAERLIYLLGLLHTHKRMSLTDMAKKCNISERTMYRDLQSLSNMNIPVYFDNGYRMTPRAPLVSLNINELELELIRFSLEHSPLIKSQRLAIMLKNIETKIIAAIPERKKKRQKQGRLNIKQEENVFTRDQDNLIIRFLKSLFNNDFSKVICSDGKKCYDKLRPISINIGKDGWILSFYDIAKSQMNEFTLEEIDKLRTIKGVAGRQ
jgi:predicted DNA-binding transcriptional regulator YafY